MSNEQNTNEATGGGSALNAELDDTLPPESGDAERFAWMIENWIMYKPPGYDGCDRGRFDLYEFTDTGDIRAAIDKARLKSNAEITGRGEEHE